MKPGSHGRGGCRWLADTGTNFEDSQFSVNLGGGCLGERQPRMRSNDSQAEFEATLAKCERLQEENDRLRRVLSEQGISLPPEPARMPSAPQLDLGSDQGRVNCRSSPEAKIALFRSLFRGREDLYAARW